MLIKVDKERKEKMINALQCGINILQENRYNEVDFSALIGAIWEFDEVYDEINAEVDNREDDREGRN